MKSARWRWSLSTLAAVIGSACSDPAPPEPEVATIELSVADTGTSIRFRDPLIVRATPKAALGVPLARPVTWTPVTPALLSVQSLADNGDSARIRATGVGRGEIRVSAGAVTRAFAVIVQDTVYSVTVSPGALSLVVGDTVSYTATVEPPNADRTVTWDWGDGTVLQTLTSPDPMVLRVQVRAAGTATVRATALADATKTAASPVTSQVGRLAFVVPPSNTSRDIPFSPRIVVAVEDAAGNTSARAANAITLSASGGSCATQLRGTVTVNATNGVAVFEDVVPSERCPSFAISATSDPVAAARVSQTIVISARGCDVAAPFASGGTTSATFETGDCVVMKGGQSFFSHSYLVTVPVMGPTGAVSFNVPTSGSTTRIEAYLWPPHDSAFLTDSLLTNWYVMPPGTYRISVLSTSPGPYSFDSKLESMFFGGGPCQMGIARGVTTLTRPLCSYNHGFGRSFIVYAPPGVPTTITARDPTNIRDPFLEVFDLSSPGSPLIASDDNSGGGPLGWDAQVILDAVPHGRFLEVRSLFPTSGGFDLILTISR